MRYTNRGIDIDIEDPQMSISVVCNWQCDNHHFLWTVQSWIEDLPLQPGVLHWQPLRTFVEECIDLLTYLLTYIDRSLVLRMSASEMTYIVSSGALNSTYSLTQCLECNCTQHKVWLTNSAVYYVYSRTKFVNLLYVVAKSLNYLIFKRITKRVFR